MSLLLDKWNRDPKALACIRRKFLYTFDFIHLLILTYRENKPGVYANDDDDLLSSGQVSPVSEDPRTAKPFSVLPLHPDASNSLTNAANKKYNLNAADPEYDKKVSEFVRKRPWSNRLSGTRVSSWSDPVSARSDVEPLQVDSTRDKNRSGEEISDDSAGKIEAGSDGEVYATGKRSMSSSQTRSERELAASVVPNRRSAYPLRERTVGQELKRLEFTTKNTTDQLTFTLHNRRQSFHDLSQFRDIKVLTPERMRIDVDLSGQFLIMWRRERHLQNVIATLQVGKCSNFCASHLIDLRSGTNNPNVLD